MSMLLRLFRVCSRSFLPDMWRGDLCLSILGTGMEKYSVTPHLLHCLLIATGCGVADHQPMIACRWPCRYMQRVYHMGASRQATQQAIPLATLRQSHHGPCTFHAEPKKSSLALRYSQAAWAPHLHQASTQSCEQAAAQPAYTVHCELSLCRIYIMTQYTGSDGLLRSFV